MLQKCLCRLPAGLLALCLGLSLAACASSDDGSQEAPPDDPPATIDLCPSDPAKTAPGLCGCGVVDSEADVDGDGVIDCLDGCPNDPFKSAVDVCPCGTTQTAQGCAQNIGSAAELAALRDLWNAATAVELSEMNALYVLKADIDLGALAADGATAIEWVGIGTRASPFNGVFLGGGKRIAATSAAGERLELTCAERDCGLFGALADGTLSDLTVDLDLALTRETTMRDEPATVGLAVGLLQGGALDGVEARGSVSAAGLNSFAGGLAGYCDGGRISGSRAEVEVGSKATAGGLLGYLSGASGALRGVASAGDVSAPIAGGLVGWMDDGAIEGASASGEAWAEADKSYGTAIAGGLVAKVIQGSIANALASGAAATLTAYYQYAGGLAGEVMAGHIANAAATGAATGTAGYYAYVGGLIGSLSVLADSAAQVPVGGTLDTVYAAGAVEGSVRAGSVSFIGSNAHVGALLGQLFVSPIDGPAATVRHAYWNSGAIEGGRPLDDEDAAEHLADSRGFSLVDAATQPALDGADGQPSAENLLQRLNADVAGLAAAGKTWRPWVAGTMRAGEATYAVPTLDLASSN